MGMGGGQYSRRKKNDELTTPIMFDKALRNHILLYLHKLYAIQISEYMYIT